MILFPAIDLYGGKAVRLLKGDYENMTVYGDDPVAIARDFVSAGATHIHLVDLEGARDGTTPHLGIVERIAGETGLFAEIGGGIRSMDTLERYLGAGVGRVILGTVAVCDEAFLRSALERHGDKVAVGVDIRDGKIAIRGWLETAEQSPAAFFRQLQGLGVKYVICTDISRDGAMRGTNLSLYRELSARYAMNITASGGVSSMADVLSLRSMGLYGAIVGKAYYTGAIDLKAALEAAK